MSPSANASALRGPSCFRQCRRWVPSVGPSAKPAVLAVAVVLLVFGAGGCRQAHYYFAGHIPPELQAPLVENVQTIDLSRFAGPPVNNDMIGRGDVLSVSLAAGLGSDDVTNLFVRVGDDGTALLPEIGRVPLAGLNLMEAEQQIATACVHRQLYRQPHVTVAMERRQINRVTVVGAVEEAGIFELPRASSYLLAAIVAAGGLSKDAGARVEIRRSGSGNRLAGQPDGAAGPSGVRLASNTTDIPSAQADCVCLNLAEAVSRGKGGEYLPDGSVVTVQKRQPDPIQVVGLVRKPGQYDFPLNHDLRLFGAIAQAGGLSTKVANKVLVLRQLPDGEGHATIEGSISAAKRSAEENLRLAPGDIVSVEQTPLTAAADILTSVIRFGVGANVPLF